MLPCITFPSTPSVLQAAVHTMGLRKTRNYCQARAGPVNPEYSKPRIMNPVSETFWGQDFTLQECIFQTA